MIVLVRNYITALSASAVLAVGLYGCGGGGGDGPVNGGVNGRPMPEDVDLSHVTPGYMTQPGNITLAAGQSLDHGDIAFSCAAGDVACEIVVMEDANGAITATSTGGMVTAMNSAAYTARITPMAVDLAPVTTGFTAGAGTVQVAAGQSVVHDDIAFSCAAGGADCEVVVTVDANGDITATSTGGTVTAVNATEPNSLRDRKLNAAINMGHSSIAPSLGTDRTPMQGDMFSPGAKADYSSIPGWVHEAYERQNPMMGMTNASTDALVVYRNTDPESPVVFADVYVLDVDAVTDPNNENDSLGNIAALDPMLVGGNMLPLSVVDGGTFPGTFDGASGEYTCTDAAGCSLAFDGSGNIISVIGSMYFTPDSGVTVLVPDSGFMYFGYWMNESTDGNGDPVFEIAGLYDGGTLSLHTDVEQLLGSATYAGSATGLYVRRWTDSANNVLRRRAGQFTADAMLTANFDVDGFVTTNDFSISGTLSNFVDGNRTIDPNWYLALGSATFGADAYGSTEFSGSTQDVDANGNPIAGAAGMGDWNGHLFGPVTVDDRSTGDVDETVRPSGVAGTFDGHFNNGDVIGAFGAEQQ